MATLTETAVDSRLSEIGLNGRDTSLLWLGSSIAVSLVAAGARFDLPIAAWIAPILLLRFSRTSAFWPAVAGVVVAMSLQMASFLIQSAIPFTATTPFSCLGVGAIFATPYLLDRAIGDRLTGFIRTMLLPVAAVMTEYVAASLLPLGASIGTRANTQSDWLALLQVIALFGPYAIGFLIALSATTANAIWERPTRATVLRYGGAFAILKLAIIASGETRLAIAANSGLGDTVKVAAVNPSFAVREPARKGVAMGNYPASAETLAAVATPTMRTTYAAVQEELLASTRAAARAGARIVIWSETAAPVLEADKLPFLQRVASLARDEGIYVNAAIGVPYERNETFLFGPDGSGNWHYRKTHPVPLMEPVAAFYSRPPVKQTRYGRLTNLICYDADWPSLSRINADIMLLPGWDWPQEGYVHTIKISRLRAIENGYSMVRADYNGLTAAFDPYGRVLASKDTLAGEASTTIVDVPTRGVTTLYSQTGDVLAWLCAALTLIICGLRYTRPTLRQKIAAR